MGAIPYLASKRSVRFARPFEHRVSNRLLFNPGDEVDQLIALLHLQSFLVLLGITPVKVEEPLNDSQLVFSQRACLNSEHSQCMKWAQDAGGLLLAVA